MWVERGVGFGGAYFVTHDNRGFFEDWLGSGWFCKDSAGGSILDKGGVSLREVAAQPGLHLELGADDRIYVHLDAHSPVGGIKADGTCRYERAKATEHIRRDVLHAFTVSLRVALGGTVSGSAGGGAVGPDGRPRARPPAAPPT